MVHQPTFLPAPWLLMECMCCVIASDSESAAGRRMTESLVLSAGRRGCFLHASAFLPGAWCMLIIPQQSAVYTGLSRPVYTYLHQLSGCQPPRTRLPNGTRWNLLGAASQRWMGYSQSSRYCGGSVSSLGPQSLGLGIKRLSGKIFWALIPDQTRACCWCFCPIVSCLGKKLWPSKIARDLMYLVFV